MPASSVQDRATHADVVDFIDERPRWRRLVGPAATIGGLGLATLYIGLVDPNEAGHYPLCPTKFMFGVDCPGCGGLRATHSLAHGDVAGAVSHNALFVLLVPVILFLLGRWVYRAWTGRTPAPTPESMRRGKRAMIALFILIAVFTVLRNVPMFSYFGSA